MANTMATETILKGQMYQRIKDLLISAGWQNISSKPLTDYDIFYSTGEAGDKNIYFQMLDYSNTATTTGNYIRVKLINKYTPGTSGTAGTFDANRTSESWRNVILFTNLVAIDAPITFSYQVNKDRIVFYADPALSIYQNSNSGNIVHLGVPILFESEPNSRGMTIAQGFYDSTIVGAAHNYVISTNPPYTDNGATDGLLTYKITPPAEYNNSDERIMSEICYGGTVEGLRGKFDGFYALYGDYTRTGHGDILTDGVSTYKVCKLITPAYWICSNTSMYAFQIS
jgi:hypothetical protein